MRRLASFFFRPVFRTVDLRGVLSVGHVTGALSIVGLATLCFLAGAALLHFQLPFSDDLTKAFQAGEDWLGHDDPSDDRGMRADGISTTHQPASAFSGFTLYTTTRHAEATLIDMAGTVVHRWKMPSRLVWPHAKGVQTPCAGDTVHWERCHVFPNGDLVALCCAGEGSPYGFGLAKFDKDSKPLWLFSANVHHDFDVDEDGRVYVLTHRLHARPPAGLDALPTSFTADQIVILSADGQKVDTISLAEALRDSPYALALLSGCDSGIPPPPGFPAWVPGLLPRFAPTDTTAPDEPRGPLPPPVPLPAPPGPFSTGPEDIFHTNSVKVLPRALAPKFPMFKAGQILISLRSPSALAVVDRPTQSIVWAAKGVWQSQHDAQFLDDGRLLLFDNGCGRQVSRAIEYDPVTQAVAWYYQGEPGKPFFVGFRGGSQRLPNGNTLIVDSERARLWEVTRTKDVVWEWGIPPAGAGTPTNADAALHLTGARRYGPDEVPFLKGMPADRPK
jgi:hypothetical protein